MTRKPAKKDKKTETAGETPALVPQPHGGALLAGGLKGNPGGRPASEIRRLLRGSFESRVPILEKFADGEVTQASAADRLRAIDMIGKYGLGETKAESHDEASPKVIAGLTAVRDAAFQFIPMDQREQAGLAMAEAWKQAVQG